MQENYWNSETLLPKGPKIHWEATSRDRGPGGPFLPFWFCSNQKHPRAASEKLCSVPNPSHCFQDGEVVIVEFGAISHLQHPQGLRLAHPSRRSIQLTSSSPCTHLDAPLAILTDPFLPTGELGGGVRRITHRDIPKQPCPGINK